MSFVVFAGCQYFGMMIGDRRCIGKDGNIISNNAIKVQKVNNDVVICAGGSSSVIDVIWKTVLENENRDKLTYEDCVSIFTEKSNSIRNEYLRLSEEHTLFTSIGVMGFKEGVICLTAISFIEGDIRFEENKYATEDDSGFCFFAKGVSKDLGKIYEQKFELCPRFTLENLKSIFYQVAKQESKNDISINTSYIMEHIERKDLIERDRIRIDK